MVNVITAGRFKGKRIKADSEGAFIPFGREHLDITREIVDHIRMISETQNKSFLSGFVRGGSPNGSATRRGCLPFRALRAKANTE